MTTHTRIEINCMTGEQTIVSLTEEETAFLESNRLRYEAEQAAKEAAAQAKAELKASAKAKLVSGQPLTAEEADTLVI